VQRVHFPKEAARLLAKYLRAERVAAGAVFRGRGGRLSVRQAQYRFRQLLAAAGIERALTVHSLRHTFATRLREETGDLRLVQVALGHRQLATTQVYGSVGDSQVLEAVRSIAY
jgi:site-specific recombinase XerC